MDNQPAIPAQPPHRSILNKNIFFFPAFLLLGFVIGFIVRPVIIPQKIIQPAVQIPAIDESKLPISLALLTNPIVYEWSGSVTGKITKKEEHSFTIVDDKGNSITITDLPSQGSRWDWSFLDSIKHKEASYSAVPVGSNLRGNFFIFKNGPNTPVGGMFTIINQ